LLIMQSCGPPTALGSIVVAPAASRRSDSSAGILWLYAMSSERGSRYARAPDLIISEFRSIPQTRRLHDAAFLAASAASSS
jgi:hypothetical protein